MEIKIKFKPIPKYRLMYQVRECLRYYQELIELKYYFQTAPYGTGKKVSMFLGIKET